jgi:aspartyl-tRNA(Asn)/glutamyl-tRNA(Gln) amidotransferase subunit B
MTWEMVIGLETHVELATKTKIFCSCTTEFGGAPNTHCCPVCTGMPGTLPVLNEKVLEYAVKAGLALNCEITRYNKFDRKNYFYPDLPKAYQISQLYLPIARHGAVPICTESGVEKDIRIHEMHMEEDAGKLVHDPWIDQTRADYNRCGVPLIEIVTEPDFRSAEEVIAYLEKLRSTLQYLGVSDCKMQEGSLRCDVNLSVRPAGTEELGTRTEMKNINSFKAITRAIEYEARRQTELIEEGKRVVQETRRWDENKDATFTMRSKENAQDYRYFPEPDIPPIEITEEYLDRRRAELPEMAEEKMIRYQAEYSLPAYDAEMITGQRALADFFEETVALGAPAKEVANWIMGQIMRQLSAQGMEAKDMTFTPKTMARLIALVSGGTLNRNTAVKVFDAVFMDDGDVDGATM